MSLVTAIQTKQLTELEDDFLVKKDENGVIYSIESVNSYPIDAEAILLLSTIINHYKKSILKLKLHICVDRGYIHDKEILNDVTTNCDQLFHSIISCINLEEFEFYVLQFPHSVIKDYFDTIIMNENVIFTKLNRLSIDINEHLLIFLNEYYGHNSHKIDFGININASFSDLNIYQSFLVRHSKLNNLVHISIQVQLSPNTLMLSMSHQQLNYDINTARNLQSILSHLIWRLLGALYFSEIQLKTFYFWCRYNVDISKFIPLIKTIINGNCNMNLTEFNLNLSHLTSNYIDQILKCLIQNCDKRKLTSFTLNALDTENMSINSFNSTLKNHFLTLSKSANQSLTNFLLYFDELQCLSLNMAQFQLHQYNQFIITINNLPNLSKIYLGDSCMPNISQFDLYDDINIWQNFCKIIDKNGFNNLQLISINIQKLDVVAQFLMKNTYLIDSIYTLYYNINQIIKIIYDILLSMDITNEIVKIMIEYIYNLNDDFVISFEGSPKLLDSKLNITKYIKQFYSNFLFQNGSMSTNIPQKDILMMINGSIIIDTKQNNKSEDLEFEDDLDSLPMFKYDNVL